MLFFVPGDLDLWPSNSSEWETKQILHVNLAQIHSAVPKTFHTQPKNHRLTAPKTEPFASWLHAVINYNITHWPHPCDVIYQPTPGIRDMSLFTKALPCQHAVAIPASLMYSITNVSEFQTENYLLCKMARVVQKPQQPLQQASDNTAARTYPLRVNSRFPGESRLVGSPMVFFIRFPLKNLWK